MRHVVENLHTGTLSRVLACLHFLRSFREMHAGEGGGTGALDRGIIASLKMARSYRPERLVLLQNRGRPYRLRAVWKRWRGFCLKNGLHGWASFFGATRPDRVLCVAGATKSAERDPHRGLRGIRPPRWAAHPILMLERSARPSASAHPSRLVAGR